MLAAVDVGTSAAANLRHAARAAAPMRMLGVDAAFMPLV